MRYIPHTKKEVAEMLNVIGRKDVESLFDSIPKELCTTKTLDLPLPLAEPALLTHLEKLSSKNLSGASSFLGAGAYRHFIPAAVTELASRSEFVTPYTPYQPEISQGTLQTMFEYQSMMCRIFGMDVSNASNYDASTALAEALLLATRVKAGRKTVCLPDNLHPEYIEVAKTMLGKDAVCIMPSQDGVFNRGALKDMLNENLAAVVVQFPNFFGIVEDLRDVAEMTHDAGALFIAAVPEPVALGLLSPPGEWGADIAVGEGLSFGLPLNFGGPGLGIFTAKETLLRSLPGRICGKTRDSNGKRGFVLTICTREQHIRREKATSNICTNHALCATTAAIYLSLLGKTGFCELARLNLDKAEYAKKCITAKGLQIKFDAPTFNEFVVELKKPAKSVLDALLKDNILGGVDLGRWNPKLSNCLLVCTTEMNSKEDIDLLVDKL